MEFYDQLNRQIKLDKIPQRIVSLVPSQTELLVDLGLKDEIVGVTKFCVHPHDIRKVKATVGGTKQIKLERIRNLNPDIILCNKEENTREIVEELEREFTVHVSDIFTIEDAYEMITQYGEIFNSKKKAAQLISNIRQEVTHFQSYIAGKPRLRAAYFIWRKPWMVAGGKTFVNHLLEMNNFENVYQDILRYPEVDIQNLKPTDLILLSSEPFPFKERHKKEIEVYNEDVKYEFVDGEYFSWYGSRLEAAFRYFRKWRETL